MHFAVSRIPTRAADKDTGIRDKRAIGIHNSWLTPHPFLSERKSKYYNTQSIYTHTIGRVCIPNFAQLTRRKCNR